jgi:hypothetical protein
MTPALSISDSEIKASAALIAAEILAHPLALQLPRAAVGLAAGVAAGDREADPHTVRALQLLLAAIDRLEIAASLGVAA